MSETEDSTAGAEHRRVATALVLFLVLAVQLALVLTRVQLQQSRPTFDARDDTAVYWAESSLQYRFARMVAEGESIPSLDTLIQHPEGVRVFRDWTVFMEYPCGLSYRLLEPALRGMPFHLYTIWFSAAFLSLALWPVFGLACRLFESRVAGLVAVVLYGFGIPASDRLVGMYARDHFALPFLFAALACFVLALESSGAHRRRLLLWQNLAGACFAVALASWHFSRFVHLLFAGVVVLLILLRCGGEQAQSRIAKTLMVSTAWIAVAALLMPVLRAKHFLLSPGLIASVAAIAVGFGLLPWARETEDGPPSLLRRAGAFATVALPLLILGALLAPETGSYGHVYSLFWDKLRFLLEKPADPTLLSMESRLLWLEAFNSPSWTYCFESFAVQAVFLLAGLMRLLWFKLRVPLTPGRWLVLGLGLGLIPLYAMVQRISVLVIFFAALGGALVAWQLSKRGLIVLCLLLVPTAVFLQRELAHLEEVTPLRRAVRSVTGWEAPWFVPLWTIDHRRLSRWVSANLPEDAAIAARAGYGPLLAVHSGRAIAMQPKWEAEGIRRKIESYYAALYGSEEELYAWCREQELTHLLLDIGAVLDDGPEGDRYVVAATDLSTATAAFRLHFAPETLARFQPVYQNMTYRLFEVVEVADPSAHERLPRQPVFKLSAFGGQSPAAAVFDDSHTRAFFFSLEEASSWFAQGQALLQAQRPQEALDALTAALVRNPSLPGANGYLGLTLIQLGRPQQGLAACRREVDLAPGEALAWRLLGLGHRMVGDGEGAYRAWLEAKRLDPGDPTVQRYLAELMATPRQP